MQTDLCYVYIHVIIILSSLYPPPSPEMVVGWYHSHPGFGCWLSVVDMNTQQVSVAPLARGGQVYV